MAKLQSDVIVPFHFMTGCDVTSSFFVVGKRTVWKRVQESLEAQMFLTQLLHKNFNKFVIKYIFNDKVRNTLTEMIAKSGKT